MAMSLSYWRDIYDRNYQNNLKMFNSKVNKLSIDEKNGPQEILKYIELMM